MRGFTKSEYYKSLGNAFNTDKTSAFGGIVALNRTLTEEVAKQMSNIFRSHNCSRHN